MIFPNDSIASQKAPQSPPKLHQDNLEPKQAHLEPNKLT